MNDTILKTIYVIGLIIGSIVRSIYTHRYRRKQVTNSRRTLADGLLLFLASIGMILPIVYLLTSWVDFADYDLPRWANWVTGMVGIPVFAAAIWLLWRSHVDLAANWAFFLEVGEGDTLVKDGVYRSVRHPMYAAHFLWAVAQALLLHNWVAGPAFLVGFLPVYFYRVPREEKMMLDHFGEEYRAYMSRTGRLFPHRG